MMKIELNISFVLIHIDLHTFTEKTTLATESEYLRMRRKTMPQLIHFVWTNRFYCSTAFVKTHSYLNAFIHVRIAHLCKYFLRPSRNSIWNLTKNSQKACILFTSFPELQTNEYKQICKRTNELKLFLWNIPSYFVSRIFGLLTVACMPKRLFCWSYFLLHFIYFFVSIYIFISCI